MIRAITASGRDGLPCFASADAPDKTNVLKSPPPFACKRKFIAALSADPKAKLEFIFDVLRRNQTVAFAILAQIRGRDGRARARRRKPADNSPRSQSATRARLVLPSALNHFVF
jgi:hypothetical protein